MLDSVSFLYGCWRFWCHQYVFLEIIDLYNVENERADWLIRVADSAGKFTKQRINVCMFRVVSVSSSFTLRLSHENCGKHLLELALIVFAELVGPIHFITVCE